MHGHRLQIVAVVEGIAANGLYAARNNDPLDGAGVVHRRRRNLLAGGQPHLKYVVLGHVRLARGA